MWLWKTEFATSFALMQSVSRRLAVVTAVMQEEVAKAGVICVHNMLLDLINKSPESEVAFDEFMDELKAVTGVIILIAAKGGSVSPTWTEFEKSALDLLDALAGFKKIQRLMKDGYIEQY